MKKFFYIVSLIICFIPFILSGCGENKFEHKLTNFVEYEKYNISAEVTNEEQWFQLNNYSFAGSQYLDITIQVKNIDLPNSFSIKLKEFDFYLTIPNVTYRIIMYESNETDPIYHIELNTGEAKTIHLKMFFDETYTKRDYQIVEEQLYVLKLWGTRI